MRSSRGNWVVAVGVFAIGAGILGTQWWRMRERESAMATMRAQLADLEKRTGEAASDLGALKREALKGQRDRNEAWRGEAKARAALEKVDPDARWSQPPSGTPAWSAESPYVWLAKNQMTNLGMAVFKEDGRLTDEAAAAFAIDAGTRKSLESELTGYVSAYRAMEAASVERTNEQADATSGNGEAMTLHIKAMPDEASQFVAEVEGSLESNLGSQRAGLLMQMGQRWLDGFGKSEQTYRVTRTSNGGLAVNVNTGTSSMSTQVSGDNPSALAAYIPQNLLAMFEEGLGLQEAGGD